MILNWEQAYDAGPQVCGGKGYNLVRLARYGFRVPRGGVLPAAAYRTLMQDASQAEALRCGEVAMLPEEVRSALRRFAESPEYAGAAIAVRSSATCEDSANASFAGIHRSILNVRGAEAIEQAVVQCYASLWTPQARAYRSKMGFHDEQVDCAVVLCEMVTSPGSDEPVCAGVCFTADPLTGRRDLLMIDAAAGLGENVVSGRVDPQRYVFHRDLIGLKLIESPTSGAVLPAQVAAELAWTASRIHWALGEGQDPQDIEWVFDGERLWIVQSRPVTRMPRCGPEALRRLPQYWSTANLKDALPGVVCELTWSGVGDVVAEIAFAAAAVSGYPVPPGVELVRRFHGRAYFDVTLMQWVFLDALGVPPAQSAKTLGGHFPLIPEPTGAPQAAARRAVARQRLRLVRRLWAFERRTAPYFNQHIAAIRAAASVPLGSMNRDELHALLLQLADRQSVLFERVGLANAASGRWQQPIEGLLTRLFGSRGPALMSALSSGAGDVTSAEQGYRIGELAAIARQDSDASRWLSLNASAWTELPPSSPFRQALQRFLNEFGHRATGEADFINPRWAEDPAAILSQIRQLLAGGDTISTRESAVQRRTATEREIRRRYPLLWPLINWMARGLRRSWSIRELGKSALVALALPLRLMVLEIGKRLVTEGKLDRPEQALDMANSDIFSWLAGYWNGQGVRELTEDRRTRRERWLAEEAPDTIAGDGGKEAAIVGFNSSATGDSWRGIAVAPGQAAGRACVVHSPEQGENLVSGGILVAPSTDPGWTPLFLRASAVVMETGGYLSHGAIVAREYGLPAVVNIPGLMKSIQDGDQLVVDGDQGTVSRVQ